MWLPAGVVSIEGYPAYKTQPSSQNPIPKKPKPETIFILQNTLAHVCRMLLALREQTLPQGEAYSIGSLNFSISTCKHMTNRLLHIGISGDDPKPNRTKSTLRSPRLLALQYSKTVTCSAELGIWESVDSQLQTAIRCKCESYYIGCCPPAATVG